LGAAAAAAVVQDLNVEQVRTAFGIAANGACGLRANMGTMSKALVSGNAARNGVMAATLAARGFTAEKSILEASQGMAYAFCNDSDIDWQAITRDLGKRYELGRGAITKEYPSCSPSHRPIEAVVQLVNEHRIRADDVDWIECDPHSFSLRRQFANDSHEGQYSLAYCLSAALLDGRMALRQMTDERVKAADVQALMRRLRIVAPPDGPVERRPKERLTIHLKNGQAHSTEVAHARRINKREDLEAKYFACVEGSLSTDAAARVRDTVLTLEKVDDIGKVLEQVRGA
jgi:2-methylcitrate dehydratase PrpD